MILRWTSVVGENRDGEVDVEPKESISRVREKIADQLLKNPDRIKLARAGEDLPDNQTVKQAGLSDGDHVKVLPRQMEGGASTSFSLSSHQYQRLQSELREIRKAAVPLRPVDGNPLLWRGKIVGQGRWADQVFPMEVHLPRDYPDSPPRFFFLRQPRPRHPNILSNGWVCLNILKDSWKHTYSLANIYEHIKWLFHNPRGRVGGPPPRRTRGIRRKDPRQLVREIYGVRRRR